MELTNENISLILEIVASAILLFGVIFIISRRRHSSGIAFLFSSCISLILTAGIVAILLFVAFAFTPTDWILLVAGVVCLLIAFDSCIIFSDMVGDLYQVLLDATFNHQAMLDYFEDQ